MDLHHFHHLGVAVLENRREDRKLLAFVEGEKLPSLGREDDGEALVLVDGHLHDRNGLADTPSSGRQVGDLDAS